MIHTWWKIIFFFFSTFTLTFHRIHIFTGVLFVRRTITQRVTLVKPSAISHTISPILRRQPELLSPFFPPARNGRQPARPTCRRSTRRQAVAVKCLLNFIKWSDWSVHLPFNEETLWNVVFCFYLEKCLAWILKEIEGSKRFQLRGSPNF